VGTGIDGAPTGRSILVKKNVGSGPCRITDRHGRAFETITAQAMKNATKVRETNLNWEWATECGTAAYCAWYVGESALAPDGPSIVAGVKDVANQLQLYLDYVAKTGGRPDFSTPRSHL
jgi:hypothetical protein